MPREVEIRITKLERDPEKGFWKCNVTASGQTYTLNAEHGSWMYDTSDGRKEVMPWVASAIQEKVRSLESKARKAEKKAKEKAEVAA